MKLLAGLTSLLLIFAAVDGEIQWKEICPNCYIEHPQHQICTADLVFVGTVLAVEQRTDVFIYDIGYSSDEVYKGLSYVEKGATNIDVYTPYGTRFCGRPNLLYKKSYLFTGRYLEGKFVITACDWVEIWDEVSDKQKRYIKTKEYLKHCNLCQIQGVKSSLTANKIDKDLVYAGQVSGLWTPYNCYYNPVASATYMGEDCETMYSFCLPSDDERCDWKLNSKYKECFTSRESAWKKKTQPKAAAAYTSLKDCKNIEPKKKKKKCIRKVKAYLKSTKVDSRELMEELMDLRNIWLDEDLFDDDDDDY